MVCRQKYANNRTVKVLTEEKTDDRDETSSESEKSTHHIRETTKIEEKNRHYTTNNSENKREERFYNRHRITDNGNATGRKD